MRLFILSLCGLLTACTSTYPPVERLAPSPITRCINLGNALESPRTEGEWGYKITRPDMVLMKEAGFDTFRLPVRWASRTQKGPPYKIRPDFMARVQEIVTWANELELNIIVNLHHFYGYGDPWGTQPHIIAIWDQISEAFKDAPDTVVFELLNEPHGNANTEFIDQLNRKLVKRLRRDHPDRWIIVSGSDWGGVQGLEKATIDYDPRLILSFHEYDPFKFTHQGVHWSRNPAPTGRTWGTDEQKRDMEARLDRAVAVRDRLNMPLFLGEFGVYQDVPIDLRAAWSGHLRREAEERGIGWCYWEFAAYFKVYDKDEERWLEPLRAALLDD